MSEGFSADWLRLREPYDTIACDRGLLGQLAAWAGTLDEIRVVDLGSGTGSNLRRTAPALACRQDWTLVEWDPALLAAGERHLQAAPVAWRYRRLDLSVDLERLAAEPCHLLTASALLDLVSASWLDRLTALRGRLGAALYVTLSYVGGVRWWPEDPYDRTAMALVDRHQGTDKGFGPALGPQAGPALATLLAGQGKVLTAASPWRLGAADRDIQALLLDGYVGAAAELAPDSRDELNAWGRRRHALVADGRSHLEVAHQDLLFLPDRG